MTSGTTWQRDGGSFRDPGGHVFVLGEEVVRSVNPSAQAAFDTVVGSGALDALVDRGLMIETILDGSGRPLTPFVGARGERPLRLLLHPRLDFVSYAHEWTFSQLRDAALCHLDAHLLALEHGMTLSDASSHNIQFYRGRPIHIDPLSLRPYLEGEPWAGYHQFCRMFLLPLLIEAWAGVGVQPLLKGSVDGIALDFGARLLPRRRLYASLNGIIHIHLHARMTRAVNSSNLSATAAAPQALPRRRHVALLEEMRRWIATLTSGRRRGGNPTYWSEYAHINSYSPQMQQEKARFVSDFARRLCLSRPGALEQPPMLICDIGGNTGEYAKVAIDAGIDLAIVFDSDLDSLEKAYARCKAGERVLPLLMDIADPSPSTGWAQRERKGLHERRGSVSALLALAVIHHLCIGRNLPLEAVVRWLVEFAPAGVIEFVPKSDQMVVRMLSAREDVFGDYEEASFLRYLGACADITDTLRLESNGRLLVTYVRKSE